MARRTTAVLLALGLSASSMAAAQEAPKGQEPPKISEEARQNFEAGVALLQDPAKPR